MPSARLKEATNWLAGKKIKNVLYFSNVKYSRRLAAVQRARKAPGPALRLKLPGAGSCVEAFMTGKVASVKI